MGQSPTNADDSRSSRVPLAEGFDAPSEQDWLDLVSKVLKGGDISRLESTTPGGLRIEPLYNPANTSEVGLGIPGEAPFVRGSMPVEGEAPAWSLRVEVPIADASSPSELNDLVLEALERGATEVVIAADDAVLGGVPLDAAALDGAALDRALSGVMVDIAPLHLRPGGDFVQMAASLAGVWSRSEVDQGALLGGFGADPIAVLARTGSLGQGIETALTQLGDLARRTAEATPGVRSITVSSVPFVNAGADEVQELAIALSVGAAYLRACAAAGLSVNDACHQIEFTLTTDADVFTGVAKLRAARRLWNTVATACGATGRSGAARINVRTSETMMTERDPWVNLLRVTAASLAAALGGADSLTTLPYDLRLGEHGELGRRMARNTHLLLAEESNLARVVDPMGGSWYIETLTNELADSAWSRFQQIEAEGGMPAVLLDGSVAEQIADGAVRRFAKVATRRTPITGVSEFPNLDEPAPGRAETNSSVDTTSGSIGSDNAGTHIEPLPRIHWSQDFETLRDRSDRHQECTGNRPTVFLVNLGSVARHTARATFASNFYAAGGINSTTSTVGATTGFDDVETSVSDAKSSGADLFCICSSDEIYAERAVEVATALVGAGLGPVHLAGRPGDLEDPLRGAGVGEFIYVGADVLSILTLVHDQVGTPELEG